MFQIPRGHITAPEIMFNRCIRANTENLTQVPLSPVTWHCHPDANVYTQEVRRVESRDPVAFPPVPWRRGGVGARHVGSISLSL